ncbi:hypothetical protein ACLESD_54110, partial [Pyxidicoccus sp. 3LFB2]
RGPEDLVHRPARREARGRVVAVVVLAIVIVGFIKIQRGNNGGQTLNEALARAEDLDRSRTRAPRWTRRSRQLRARAGHGRKQQPGLGAHRL